MAEEGERLNRRWPSWTIRNAAARAVRDLTSLALRMGLKKQPLNPQLVDELLGLLVQEIEDERGRIAGRKFWPES